MKITYRKQLYRLTAISKILNETREDNPLTYKQINTLLDDLKCDRTTFYDAIKVLKEDCSMKIESKYFMQIDESGKRKRVYGYYCEPTPTDCDKAPSLLNNVESVKSSIDKQQSNNVAKRSENAEYMNLGEIRFLLDAIQSAAFISKSGKERLFKAVSALADDEDQALIWRENVVSFDKFKNPDETNYDKIEYIDVAIEQGQSLVFKYIELDVDGKSIRRRDKHGNERRHHVHPIGLIYNDGNCYMYGYDVEQNRTTVYRVDRMCDIKDGSNVSVSSRLVEEFKYGGLKDMLKVSGMWTGNAETVTLQFAKSHVTDIYDKFGDEIFVKCIDENTCQTMVKVIPSAPFFGWCVSFGDVVTLVSPENVKQELQELIKLTALKYNVKL